MNLQGRSCRRRCTRRPSIPSGGRGRCGRREPDEPSPTAPIYRFATYLQKAIELTNDVRSFGALILSALEKKDAESLAVLRANQELDIQTMMLDVKTKQVTEAQDQITALQNQKAVAQIRYTFYSTIAFMNAGETQACSCKAPRCSSTGSPSPLDLTRWKRHLCRRSRLASRASVAPP